LHNAANWSHKEIVELLIAKGADVTVNDKRGRTPLHEAWNKEVAELLITAGADVNAKDGGGDTPLDWAIKYKRTETADLLRKHGGKAKTPDISIHEAAGKGNIEAVKQNLAIGADVNKKDQSGATSLHNAVSWGHMSTVRFLIDNGANVNAVNGHGETPLHAAAFSGRKEILDLLMSNGANINAKNRPSFKTPLDKATTSRFPIPPEWETARKETAALIRKHGGKTSEEIRNTGQTKKEIKDRKDRITCVNNLKKIGIALRIYATDNEDCFPWQVPQAKGGTAELAKPRSDSSNLLDSEGKPIFDVDAWVHFQALNNRLQSPSVLRCPSDTRLSLTVDDSSVPFGKNSVSYLLRTDPEVEESRPNEIAVLCPHHNGAYNIMLTDSSVMQAGWSRLGDIF